MKPKRLRIVFFLIKNKSAFSVALKQKILPLEKTFSSMKMKMHYYSCQRLGHLKRLEPCISHQRQSASSASISRRETGRERKQKAVIANFTVSKPESPSSNTEILTAHGEVLVVLMNSPST